MGDETTADAVFRAQAKAEGYLTPYGEGLWAWYRRNGIIPPEWLRRTIPKHELTGFDLEREIEG